jgi:hypothetical protein
MAKEPERERERESRRERERESERAHLFYHASGQRRGHLYADSL